MNFKRESYVSYNGIDVYKVLSVGNNEYTLQDANTGKFFSNMPAEGLFGVSWWNVPATKKVKPTSNKLVKTLFGNFNIGKWEGPNVIKTALNPETGKVQVALRTNKGGEASAYSIYLSEGRLMNVCTLTFGNSKQFYKIPVSKVKAGDIVLVDEVPMFLDKVLDNGNWQLIDPNTCNVVTHINQKSIFGNKVANWFTKIVPVTDLLGQQNTADLNENPALLLAMLEDDNYDKDSLLKLLFRNNGLISPLLSEMANSNNVENMYDMLVSSEELADNPGLKTLMALQTLKDSEEDNYCDCCDCYDPEELYDEYLDIPPYDEDENEE